MTKRNLLLVGLLLVFGLGVMAPAALAQVTEGNPTFVNVQSAVFTLRPNSIGDAGGAVFINFSSGYGTIAGGEVFSVTFSQPIVGASSVGSAPVADFCSDANAVGIVGKFCSAMTITASGNTLTLTNGPAAISGWTGATSGQSYITIFGIRFNTTGVIPGTYITAYVSAAFNQSYPIEFSTSGLTQSGVVNIGQVANTAIGGSVLATSTPTSVLTCIGPTEEGTLEFTISVKEQWSGAWTSLSDELGLAPFAPTASLKATNGSQIAIVLTGIPDNVTVTPLAVVVTLGTPVFAAAPAAFTCSTVGGCSNAFVYTLTSTVRQELEAANFGFDFTLPSTGISVNNPPMQASVELYPPPNASTPVYPAFVYPNGSLIEEPNFPLTAVTFVGCQTSLLWPYVTNYTTPGGTAQNNFDTAVAVANTTSDPFGPPNYTSYYLWPGGFAPEVGACKFYVYSAGTSTAPATSITPVTATPVTFSRNVILSGGVDAFLLSSEAPGTGFAYMIATCNFLGAVGYGAIIDNANGLTGNWGFYSNYLAYVIPNPNIVGRTWDGVVGEFAIEPWASFFYYDGATAGSSGAKMFKQSFGLHNK